MTRRFYAALAECGAPLNAIEAFDILPSVPGIDFDGAWERRVDAATGLTVNFISRDDLIASKLSSGRLRDLADVEDLSGECGKVWRLIGDR